jgi:glucose-6-phosphate 1-dehydrogenase
MGMSADAADVLVIFGITGDLAKQMTFRSLYRLERRGVLKCRIVGVAVDDWTPAMLRRHMREAVRDGGERVERAVFDRLAQRITYVQGDFDDAGTYAQVAAAIDGVQRPLAYLETPPSLFGRVVRGLAAAGLTSDARIMVEKPFGRDLASARALAAELHRSVREEQIFRVDHFLGKVGLEELLYLRFANAMLDSVWDGDHVACVQITMAEQFGVDDRGRFYDAVGTLRDVLVNHLLQLLAAATMDAPPRGRRSTGPATRCSGRWPTPIRRATSAGSTAAIAPRQGSPGDRRQRPTRRSSCGSTTNAGATCRSMCAPASTCVRP